MVPLALAAAVTLLHPARLDHWRWQIEAADWTWRATTPDRAVEVFTRPVEGAANPQLWVRTERFQGQWQSQMAKVAFDCRAGQVAVLQVEDSGPGIPTAEREQVFRPFYRALGTGVDGSGLGLAIVREIATRHGAEVALEDADSRRRDGPAGAGESGPGALFTVRFPAAPASALHQPPALRDGHQQAQPQAQ